MYIYIHIHSTGKKCSKNSKILLKTKISYTDWVIESHFKLEKYRLYDVPRNDTKIINNLALLKYLIQRGLEKHYYEKNVHLHFKVILSVTTEISSERSLRLFNYNCVETRTEKNIGTE